MQRVGVKGIHIAERDTQRARTPKPRGKFVNTWSVEGFIAEGLQPSELGWGTHEKALPAGGARHDFGCDAAIYLKRPGAGTRVRSWTPTAQAQHAWMITHNESISIADYFTARDESDKVVYRPTCHYAYHPCDDAVLSLHEMAGAAWKPQATWHILTEDDIVDGVDELGVLLYGHAKNAYWYGSQLSIEETRRLAPYQNATGLQVTSAVLAGIVWMLENPDRGLVEADEMDFRRCLEIQRPYLGDVFGHYTDWTPLDRPRRAVPGGRRQRRSVAVQERARALTRTARRRGDDVTTDQASAGRPRSPVACSLSHDCHPNFLRRSAESHIFRLPNFARACGCVSIGGVRTRGRTAAYGREIFLARCSRRTSGPDRTPRRSATGGETGAPRAQRGTRLKATTERAFLDPRRECRID